MRDDDMPQPARLTMEDVHVTDVLWDEQGEYVSVLKVYKGQGLIRVRDTTGHETTQPPGNFTHRWALAKTGHLNISWRVSPLDLPRF